MLSIIYEIVCFVMLINMVYCIIPEEEIKYEPRPRPEFNLNLWEPCVEPIEKHKLSERWTKAKSEKKSK
ncbi:unnamed protein product [Caenorhabditis angaria]|uniref:Uncharacterized protein n=1 Tax=Caenorhabditis angaria TaxID=860376 RepID=A0A9P1IZ15_9PELO|nr:unnamed protein product [Caenorhabditis angaria]